MCRGQCLLSKTICQNAHRVGLGFSFSEYFFDKKHVKIKRNTNSEAEMNTSGSTQRKKEYR